MVRCDMVDGMDRYLCEAFHTHMPFGGKQVVFVGDLFQLPPVVADPADEDMLNDSVGEGQALLLQGPCAETDEPAQDRVPYGVPSEGRSF